MILYTIYLDFGGPNSAPHPSTPGPRTSSCLDQGKTPYDYAKQNVHRQVMGVLDPVPWRWDEHPLVDQGFGTRGAIGTHQEMTVVLIGSLQS